MSNTVSVNSEEYAKLRVANARLTGIQRMCGHVAGATDATFKIFEDDATREWCITIGKSHYHAISFMGVIDKAILGEMEKEFRCWVEDTYHSSERQQVLDHFVQSGQYPEEFLQQRIKYEN